MTHDAMFTTTRYLVHYVTTYAVVTVTVTGMPADADPYEVIDVANELLLDDLGGTVNLRTDDITVESEIAS